MIRPCYTHTASVYASFDAPSIYIVVSAPEKIDDPMYEYIVEELNENHDISIEPSNVTKVDVFKICPEHLTRPIEVNVACRATHLAVDEEWDLDAPFGAGMDVYDHLDLVDETGEMTFPVRHKNGVLHYVHMDDIDEDELKRVVMEECRRLGYTYHLTGFSF